MRYTAVLVATAGLVAAQSASDFFPECALDCLDAAVESETSCSLDDATCQCEEDNITAIQTGATSCVISACGATVAVSEVLPAAEEFCAAVAAAGSSSETTVAETTAAETTEAETTAAETTTEEAATTTTESEAAETTEAEEETTAEAETTAEETATTMETATSTAANGTTTATTVPVSGASSAAAYTGFLGLFLAALAAF